jgi:hypothetical protein
MVDDEEEKAVEDVEMEVQEAAEPREVALTSLNPVRETL